MTRGSTRAGTLRLSDNRLMLTDDLPRNDPFEHNPIRAIVGGIGPMPLVRGRAAPATARDLIARAQTTDIVRAGLYLFGGFWDEAHETAQSIDTPDGSYWHAIVHRQEPDGANATYW